MTTLSSSCTRSALWLVSVALAAASLAGCGGSTSTSSSNGMSQIDGHTMGDPCTPKDEDLAAYAGSAEQDVAVGNNSGSGSAMCLVNHFRGRVTCPYGQDANGVGPNGAPSCKTPSGQAVVGNATSPGHATVPSQCLDRRASKTVHWSCRCADDSGRTDDGDTYCKCPSSMACAPLIVGSGPEYAHISGSYCIHAGAEFDRSNVCSASCDPGQKNCP